MTERLQELERRVARLIERYRESQQKVHDLEGQLAQSAGQLTHLKSENEQLKARLSEMETDLGGRSQREETVRGKLHEIIGQIDSLEAEIARIEDGGHESRQ